MTQHSRISKIRSFKMDPKPKIGDSDGITNRTMNIILVVLSFMVLGLTITSTALAQNSMDPVMKELTESALLDMNQNKFVEALEKLTSVQWHAPSASVDHLMGVCYVHMGNHVAAEIHLESAVQNMVEEEDSWSPFGEKAPIHALNYLGKTYYDKGEFDTAVEYFSKFLVSLYMMDDTDQWMIDWTEEAIAQCEENLMISQFRPY